MGLGVFLTVKQKQSKGKKKKNTQKAPMLLGFKFGVMEIQSFV